MRSNAEFLVELPVGCLVRSGAVLGVEATGAGLRGWDLAVGKGAVRSRFGRGRGFGPRLASFHFCGRLVSVEGV